MIALKILGIISMIAIAFMLVLVISSLIKHRICLNKEKENYPPPGTIVSINGIDMHVYAVGSGEISLVFLSGHATSCPTLDFKPLWSQLTDYYKAIIVERAGYGWSDSSTSSKDVDTMLEQSRKALKLTENSPPYVLVPHSMSCLEALRWAQKYPSEVQAIIGLDPCTPAAVNLLPRTHKTQLDAIHVISRIGFTRFMPESDMRKNLPLLDSGSLTDYDKDRYLALFFRSAVTSDMVKEFKHLKSNAEIVGNFGVPDSVPMLFFLSEEQEVTAPGWIITAINYLSSISQGTYNILATSHYVHHQESELIASRVRQFITQIMR